MDSLGWQRETIRGNQIVSFGGLHGELLDLVNTDVVVGETSIELVIGLVPCERGATNVFGLGGGLLVLGGGLGGVDLVGEHGGLLNLLDVAGRGEVEHLDTIFSSDDDPVEFLGEKHAVDGGVILVGGEPFALNKVPDHDLTVVGAGCQVGRVVDHIDGVDLSLVANAGVHEFHVGVVPNLDGLIPRSGNADRGFMGVVEAYARDGIGMGVLVNGMLALGLDVPDLDLVITSSGEDLSVISGKSNGKDILGVSNELVHGLAGLDVPETDGTIPRGREAEASIASQADLLDKVRMSGEHLGGLTPLNIVLLGALVEKLPLDKCLVTGSRKKEFNSIFFTDSKRSDPATVTLEVSLLFESVFSFVFV